MATTLPIAGWYPDPEIPGQDRWWDGTTWSQTRRPTDAAAVAGVTAPAAGATAPVVPAERNTAALVGLILSCSALLLPFVLNSFAGGIVSIVALRRSTQLATHGILFTGRGLAIAGILVGFIWGAICLIGILLVVAFTFWIVGIGNNVQYPDSPVM